MTNLPLEGIRVADFGHIVAIPYLCQLMGWMGAEVILIEGRGKQLMRNAPPYAYDRVSPNTSAVFNMVSGNKRSCSLNLTTAQGRELAKEIIRVSDVVVENFSTGTMENLGLGYDDLRKVKPDIIMLSMDF